MFVADETVCLWYIACNCSAKSGGESVVNSDDFLDCIEECLDCDSTGRDQVNKLPRNIEFDRLIGVKQFTVTNNYGKGDDYCT